MRLLHTADWHLGRSLHGVRLLNDQAHVLDQLIVIARNTHPDVVVIAGDIYDRSIPPGDAIELLDEVLARLILDLRLPVIMIAGNHDGPQLMNFGSRLFAAQRLFTFGMVGSSIACVTVCDTHGPVHLYALPYAEPLLVRQQLGDDTIFCHDTAMRGWVNRVVQQHPKSERAIAVGHAFLTGGVTSESERQLVIGGAGTVSSAWLAPFHYVALGHLHAPQQVGDPRIQYAGSLLKYSFSEIDHQKSVTLVEMDRTGAFTTERIALTPRRDLRRLEGHLADLLRRPRSPADQQDYLVIRLLDTCPLVDPMNQLRAAYPNVVHLERPGLETGLLGTGRPTGERGRNPDQLFADFFSYVTGRPLEPAQVAVVAEAVQAAMQQPWED